MKPVTANISLPKLEESIIEHWRENRIFERSMEKSAPHFGDEKLDRKQYVFFDGPPFATGLPHYGHLLAGTIKDVVGRFFTMKGFHVDRRFGWDCHGVPVEFEIQKTLELHGAKAIREYGIARFNEECRKIVLRYSKEWEKFVERSGRWVDFNRQYRTMDIDYMESIWWVIGQLWNKGLIYEGVKCVPYSWAINTPLSNFEANLNYKTVQDPAVTVRVKIVGDLSSINQATKGKDCYTYIWTTTPWTLPSNMALAVSPSISYALVEKNEEVALIAKSRLEEYFPELTNSSDVSDTKILGEVLGTKLAGCEYQPVFPYFAAERERNAFRIYAADFVTETEGTGIVHLASFGEDDLSVFQKHGITIIDPVDEDGKFTSIVSDFAGQNIKEADPKVIAYLKQNKALVSHKTIEHSYPFCWRTDTPLIYKSISSWFVKVEAIKDLIIKNNQEIRWVPEHIRDGRFGKWLENARDWAISRNRFWGTPIPFWRCKSCSNVRCISSAGELAKLSGHEISDLHSHFIDSIEIPCNKCSEKMKRVPEVLDCWFESGAMPYAQVHFPFEGGKSLENATDEFLKSFPADFIAEGLDQTRGWFYTLLVISTALFNKPAFKNVIVNGIVLAEDGKKMSKSLRNYPPPDEVMGESGADAMRLYLLSSPASRAEDLRFSKKGVRDTVRQTLLPLWNAYNFFVTYALVDCWTPEKVLRDSSPNLLDRWILSKLNSLTTRVDHALTNYRLYEVLPPILDYVDQLTNWYIRLNRRRFWQGGRLDVCESDQMDKLFAYSTLYQSLIGFVKVLAPLAPFISEEIFLNLKGGSIEEKWDSVHMSPFPSLETSSENIIDEKLEHSMELFEQVILLGRGLRNDHNLKVRQPLRKLIITHTSSEVLEGLKQLEDYTKDELNVKEVFFTSQEEDYVTLKAKLNTVVLGKTLGPKLGSEGMKKLRAAAEMLTTSEIKKLENGESIVLEGETISAKEILISRAVKVTDLIAASSGEITIVLDTVIDQELALEGLSREFVNRVQKQRKDSGYEVADRIVIRFLTASPKLSLSVAEHAQHIKDETLAVDLVELASEAEMQNLNLPNPPVVTDIEGDSVIISLQRVHA